MSVPRTLRRCLGAVLVLTACAEEAPTGPPIGGAAETPDLRLTLPSLRRAHLVPEASSPTSPEGPLAVEGDPASEDPADYLSEVGTIYDARTLVGFGPDHAYSWADHRYQGNKGRVETTARVSLDGASLGTQSAAREQYGLFLIEGPTVKYIAVDAKIYSDRTCGLQVQGHSVHAAWWEWFLGGGVPSWGRIERPSSASPRSQAACGPTEEEQPSGGGGSFGGATTTCWISIDYDLETGEVLSVEVLYCSTVSEEVGG